MDLCLSFSATGLHLVSTALFYLFNRYNSYLLSSEISCNTHKKQCNFIASFSFKIKFELGAFLYCCTGMISQTLAPYTDFRKRSFLFQERGTRNKQLLRQRCYLHVH